MGFLTTLAVLLVIAAVISVVLAFLGVVVGVAFHLLPFVLLVLAVVFFIKGGKVHIEWPGHGDENDTDDDTIDVHDYKVR